MSANPWERQEKNAHKLLKQAKETELKEYEDGREIDLAPHIVLLRDLQRFLLNALEGYYLPTARERDAKFIKDSILILFKHFAHEDSFVPGEDVLIKKLEPVIDSMKSWEKDFGFSSSASQVLLREELERRLSLYRAARGLLDKRRELLQKHFTVVLDVVFEEVDQRFDGWGNFEELDSATLFAAARKRDELFQNFTVAGLQEYFSLVDALAATDLYRRKENQLLGKQRKKYGDGILSSQDLRDELEVLTLWQTLTEVEINP